jgi:hypothetical protein
VRRIKIFGLQGAAAKAAISVLALGVASTAVVLGTQAAWTDSTTNAGNSVASGNLDISGSGATLISVTGKKPGDNGTANVTLENTGSSTFGVTLTQATITNDFDDGANDYDGTPAGNSDITLYVYDAQRDYCYYPDDDAGVCTGYGNWVIGSPITITNDAGGADWLAAEPSHQMTIGWEFKSSATKSMDKSATMDLVWSAA